MENLKENNTDRISLRGFPLLKGKQKRQRIWELDFIRGICVLLMIWDHFMYDIYDIFGDSWVMASSSNLGIVELAEKYWDGPLRTLFHPIIFSLFFILCGISCNLSRNNLKRGIEALFLAFGITAVTSMFGAQITILFGVLHMLAFSIIIYYIISKVCLDNKRLISLVCLIAGIVIILVNQYYIAYPPENADQFMGFIAEYFDYNYSADYFPLLPHLGYVLLGASVGEFIYGGKQSVLPILDKYGWYKPISFWGNKALLVYVLHQPIIVGAMALISYLFITPGNWVFSFAG